MAFIGDQRNQQQITDGYRLQAVLPNGAVWNNGAGGYVINGKVVSTTPQFVPKDDPTSLANVDPAAVQAAQAKGKTNKAALAAGTVDGSGNNSGFVSGSGSSVQAYSGNTDSGTYGQVDYSGMSIEDILDMAGGNYDFLSEDEINNQASSRVDADIASQVANYNNEINSINSKYSPLFAALDESLAKTDENALKSVHRRGLATSGIVDYEREKLDKDIQNQRIGLQGQQATEVGNVQNSITTLKNNRGNLIDTAAASIRSNDLTKGTALITAKSGITQALLDKLIVDANTKYATDADATKSVGETRQVTTNNTTNKSGNNGSTNTVQQTNSTINTKALYDPNDSNQNAYLQNLKATGDQGQQTWANQQIYLRNLLNSSDAGIREWARQQLASS
jgi:hypothetical protein